MDTNGQMGLHTVLYTFNWIFTCNTIGICHHTKLLMIYTTLNHCACKCNWNESIIKNENKTLLRLTERKRDVESKWLKHKYIYIYLYVHLLLFINRTCLKRTLSFDEYIHVLFSFSCSLPDWNAQTHITTHTHICTGRERHASNQWAIQVSCRCLKYVCSVCIDNVRMRLLFCVTNELKHNLIFIDI